MIPLVIPWRLIGAGALVAAVALAGWRISAWHASHKALPGVRAALEAEESCGPDSRCAARQAALEAKQAQVSKEVVAGYEKELADLRNRPPVTRVIRVCKANPGDVRDAAHPGGTAATPGTGVVHEADEFDTGPLRDLARQADEVSAAYRALRSRDEALSGGR